MAKEILYRIDFEGAKEQVDNLVKIGNELDKIRSETKFLTEAQKTLVASGYDLNDDQKARIQQLKVEGQIKQQLYRKEQQALKDQKNSYKATSGTLEELRIKARQLGKELETGPKIGSKRFNELAAEVNKVNEQIRNADKSAGNFKSNIGNYAGDMGGAFRKLGGIIGVALSGRELLRFGTESARLYDEEIKSQQGLLVALKGRRDIQEKLIEQAGQLQQKTLFGDDVTVEAQKQLAVFGLTKNQIVALIPLIQDMSVALSMDLTSSAQLVGKSIGSTTNALKRYGVDMDATASKSEKVAQLVENLTKKFQGQAEAAALAGTGAATQASNAWGDFREILGKIIATNTSGFFRSLTNELYNLNQVLNDESIPTWEKFYSLFNSGVRNELKWRSDIISKVKEQKNSELNASIERIDLIYQDIEVKKALIEQLKTENAENIKKLSTDKKIRTEAKAKVAEDNLTAHVQQWADLNEQIRRSIEGANDYNTSVANWLLKPKGITTDTAGVGGLRSDAGPIADAPEDTGGINRDQINTALDTSAQFVSIWQDAYSMQTMYRQEELDRQLQAGLISEKQYNKEVGKLKSDQARKDKAAALAQIAINTAGAIMKIWADVPKVDFGVSTIALTAIASAIGVAQAAVVASQKIPKYAEGGLIAGGKSHAHGGTKFVGSDGSAFEAERGELIAVVNKTDTKRLRQLSDLNSRHGRSFYGQPSANYFASGGIFQPNPNMGSGNQDALIRSIVSQIGNIPVEVSLNEIESKSSLKRKVNVIGSL